MLASAGDTGYLRQKRLLAHAFSERSLRDQEKPILGNIDIFIRRLEEYANIENEGKPINLTNPGCYRQLSKEVRISFSSKNAPVPASGPRELKINPLLRIQNLFLSHPHRPPSPLPTTQASAARPTLQNQNRFILSLYNYFPWVYARAWVATSHTQKCVYHSAL
ncbi:cytochrome P450 [Penicillium digitatum]|uniref:Cytochrome P450 n=1 Tax=Penicillium digitatum TaxID=36651 RepID=A0A7T7BI26_PENDI|nr:cytochrome P450 [Penicillium digitatum]